MKNHASRKNPAYGYTDSGHLLASPSEKEIFDSLKAEGYDVYKHGWPDFIAVKGDEVRFIEAKGKNAALDANQLRVHKILATKGINVEIVRSKDQ